MAIIRFSVLKNLVDGEKNNNNNNNNNKKKKKKKKKNPRHSVAKWDINR